MVEHERVYTYKFILQNKYYFQIYVLTNYDNIRHLADLYAGMFLVVAAVAGATMCLQSFTFTTAGLKMTSRLRQQYFSSLLKQVILVY